MWIDPSDLIKMFRRLDYYLACDLNFVKDIGGGINYPVGELDDIKIYLQHYRTCEEAKQRWKERLK